MYDEMIYVTDDISEFVMFEIGMKINIPTWFQKYDKFCNILLGSMSFHQA